MRGRPSNFERELTITANENHRKFLERMERTSVENCIKDRTVKLTSMGQLPDLFKGAKWGRSINNKAVEEITGKDKGHVSRLLSGNNMTIETFLKVCKALKLEVYIKGRIYKEET